jgi:hypothetical protein
MKEVVSYQPLLESEDYDIGIVGRSEAMQNVFKLIGQLSASDATALITGESGTGKELVARAIYHHSRRSDKPFLAVNCAAIPENLLESELFGHEKGSFTGASAQRIGKFEQCNGGTIFLDEKKKRCGSMVLLCFFRSRTLTHLLMTNQVYDIASTKVVDQQIYSDYDDEQRPRRVTFLDGTYEQTAYGCCGPDSVTGRAMGL